MKKDDRKDFSFNEKMTWAELLKEEYSKIARENMSKGGEGFKISENLNSAKNIASEVGFGSVDTYYKAQYIHKNADEEMIKQLDDGKLSINKAYITLKDKAKELELKANQLEQKNKQLEDKLEQERNKPVEVKEVIKEKVIDKTDYSLRNKIELYKTKSLSNPQN